MSASQKLRWRKLVNQLRYMYEELDIVSEMGSATAQEFQEYYEEFCQKHDIDIAELNRKHAERVHEVYNANHADNSPPKGNAPYSGSTGLVPFEENPDTQQLDSAPVPHTDEHQMHEIFSKLFKKLALQLHPDKLATRDLTEEQKNDMLQMFTKARSALDEKRYFILIDYAEKLGVPLPKNYRQQTRWMKREVTTIRERIGNEMRSYNYMFAEADSDDQRDTLIAQFLQQLFDVVIPQEVT